MSLELEVDIADFLGDIQLTEAAIDAAQKEAVSEAVQSYYATSVNELRRGVYNVEIPRRPRSGKPRWKRRMRRGGILGAEKYAVAVDGKSGQIFTDPQSRPAQPIKNSEGGYAERRQKEDGKYTRKVPWRALAFVNGRQRAAERLRKAFANKFNRR